MEASTVFRSSPYHYTAAPSRSSCILAVHRPNSLSFDAISHLTTASLKCCRSINLCNQRPRPSALLRSRLIVRAAAEPSSSSIAPLKLESPIGQFLSQILVSHPHLLPAAVDQQLQQLQTDRDVESSKDKDDPFSPSGTDLVLYRRIAEVKAIERKRALEEIIYALVVQKFVEADISLVPAISQPSDSSDRVDRWPMQEEKLENHHSQEAYEMIKNHLALILGQQLEDPNSVAPISKLRVGQVYAASIMYGYFLKRVDQRFQLEKSMKTLPWGSEEEEEESAISQALPDESRPSAQSMATTHPEVSSSGYSQGIKPSRLRSYVMSFDAETLQQYAAIRSKEAFRIIEKQTEALFGRPEIDEVIKISFVGLRRLILEAVTFGSFLWDVESYVESRYRFVSN